MITVSRFGVGCRRALENGFRAQLVACWRYPYREMEVGSRTGFKDWLGLAYAASLKTAGAGEAAYTPVRMRRFANVVAIAILLSGQHPWRRVLSGASHRGPKETGAPCRRKRGKEARFGACLTAMSKSTDSVNFSLQERFCLIESQQRET